MAEVTYTSVVWTAGDILTEAKLDNMVANDRAVDALFNGVEFTERADPSTPASNKIHIYAKDKSGIPALYAINDAGIVYELSEGRPTFETAIVGPLIVGTSKTPIIGVYRNLTIVKAYVWAKTAPTGADAIFDFNKNGTSIWNTTQANRITLPIGDTYAVQTSFDTVTLSEGDALTFDVDQVGSTESGQDATLVLRCK